ncbi:MAG TPA: cyclase family protein [Nitrolancea sp.]|nr:cyclase family protein [Nitrolancea sp.]
MLIDLSHPLDGEIPMFPGLPAPAIEVLLSREDSRSHYAGDTTFVIHRYAFAGNSGTYLDTPFHRHAAGADTASLPLAATADLRGLVVDVRVRVAQGERGFGPELFAGLDLAGAAVLVCTGWDRLWGAPEYLGPNPFLSREAGQLLVERGASLVGIDSWNIDDTGDGTRPVHTALLAAGIPIVENLCRLDQLPAGGFRFSAVPLPIRGGSAVPVRAFASIET